MRGLLFALALGVVACAGCADKQAAENPNPFLVPSTALLASGRRPSINPNQILPGSDGDLYFARGEKVLYGSYLISDFSAYSIYTYGSQPIYVPNTGGSGYRNTIMVQQGISLHTP